MPASDLISNPNAAEAIQEESFFDTIPDSVAKRIYGLKALQDQHHVLEKEFHNEILALEKVFAERCSSLHTQRSEIVSGKVEPSPEQVTAGQTTADKEEEGVTKKGPKPDVKEIIGIPEFWLTCLKNHGRIAEIISERDEEALLSLVDIRVTHFEDSTGYSLRFDFTENEFFTNQELVKTYYFKNSEPTGSIVVDRTEGTVIDWKEGKDLTLITKARKQRVKGSTTAQVVKKIEPAASFFNFFNPKNAPDSPEGDEDDFEAQLAFDFDLAETIKDKLIFHAVDWYTGYALEYEGSDQEDEFDSYDCITSEEEDNSEESEEELVGPKGAEVGPECKQQ